jgi:hypothetical protein
VPSLSALRTCGWRARRAARVRRGAGIARVTDQAPAVGHPVGRNQRRHHRRHAADYRSEPWTPLPRGRHLGRVLGAFGRERCARQRRALRGSALS